GRRADLERCAYRGELWAHTDREPGRPEPSSPSPPRMRPSRPLQEPEQTALLLGLSKLRSNGVRPGRRPFAFGEVRVMAPLLSPRAFEIPSATHSYPSLSLDVYATRQAALQTLAYLLFFCLTLLLVNNKSRIKLLAQAIILGGVFQAAYGSLMTLSGLEHGIFIDQQDVGVATGTFINRNHLAGYLEMCLATGVGLMLAELSST